MSIFESIKHERQRQYERAGVKRFSVPSKYAFFPNEYPRQVTFLDPFQSKQDFQNDLTSILIKPATCHFLSWFHKCRALYELWLTIAHLVSLSPQKALSHGEQAANSFVASVIYSYLTIAEALLQTLSFLMRSIISIGIGVYKLPGAVKNLAEELSAGITATPATATLSV